MASVEPIRRWAFHYVLKSLKQGLSPITVLRGPRQVGKTTLLKQIAETLLNEGVPPDHIFRVQFDDIHELKGLHSPLIQLPRWFAQARLGCSLNQALADGKVIYLLLDEVQNLTDWATQLKSLVDLHALRVLVTGSSALRIEAGKDSLAGRLTTIEMGPLLLREIGEIRGMGHLEPPWRFNGLAELKEKKFWKELRRFGELHQKFRTQSFAAFSERGAYPRAQVRADISWDEVSDHLVDAVVRRAIVHDLRMGEKGKRRDQNLLEEVFRLACRYAGQAPGHAHYVAEVKSALNANVGWPRILTYLKFLDGTLLVRLIDPLELRLKKRRGPPKLVLCDHAIRAAWLQEIVPLDPMLLHTERFAHLSDLAGRLAESAAGYFFTSLPNLNVAHFPERGAEPEVDFVLTIGEQRIPVEIKYRRRIESKDTLGLRSFIEKSHYRAPFGLLITQADEEGSDDPRIVSLPLSTLLLLR